MLYISKISYLRFVSLFGLLIIVIPFTCLGQNVSIEQKAKQIKTYPYSDPNPVPGLAINNDLFRFYPYFMWNGYTTKSTYKKWKVITLQNPYIKVKILPQVGGKVWGAIEKSTGKAFVYLNHVLKFRAIGIRGPWTNGGIEHNFGLDLGHAPWTASPVDYIIKKNPDGSVSCVVGGLDLASQTHWQVTIRVPKNKAYFQTKSLWYNPTPLHDPYLAWENAAFAAGHELQFYYPGDRTIYHNGLSQPWPISKEGRNLSRYSENNFGGNKSYHVVGTYNNWYGGYWHNENFGFGHWALYSDAPGKKIWIWSLAPQGSIWKHLLTDTDGQYIEAQAGVKFNQASLASGYHSPYDQLSLRPGYADTKTDDWFPVKGTGGMVDASPYGVLNVTVAQDSLKIAISPNAFINDSLVVSKGSTQLYYEMLHLKPMHTYYKTIPLHGKEAIGIDVTVGKNKLSYIVGIGINERNKVDRPVRTTINKEEVDSPPELLRIAHDENSMRLYNKALRDYMTVLKREPTNNKALSMVAELYYRRAEYKKGSQYALKALETNTYDPDGNFIYGALQEKMNHLVKAEEAYSVASYFMEYRSAAYAHIAGISIKQQDYKKAITYAKKALNYNRNNLGAYEFLGTSYRKIGKTDKAQETFEKLLKVDPLSHYARFEQYLLHPSIKNLNHFKSLIRNEFPDQTYLELALEYASREGLKKDAIQVLEQAPSNPVVYYWLAYLKRNTFPSKSQSYLKRAEKMPADFVFPYRLETIPVLTWALNQNKSWKTSYYLGLIYWSKLCIKKAKKLFKSCNNISDYAPFYLARGRLFQNNGGPKSYPLQNYKRAVKLNPKGWRTWYYLISYFLTHNAFQEELNYAQQAYHRFPHNTKIGLAYAEALYNANKYKRALKILKSTLVLPQEHARKGHVIFANANLSLALENLKQKKYQTTLHYLQRSQKWPEHLGEGKPFTSDVRLQNYIAAYCESKLGNSQKHHQFLDEIKDYTLKHWGYQEFNPTHNAAGMYIGAKTLEILGKLQKAHQLLARWKVEEDSLKYWRISQGSASPQVQWVFAKFNNQEKVYQNLEKKILADKRKGEFQILLEALKIITMK
jgi:tetratricopeptide (TPR) repeat protein